MSDNVAGVMTPADELAIMKARPNVFPARVVALVRAAWAEGFDAGEIDAFDADRPGHTCTPNPYKKEA